MLQPASSGPRRWWMRAAMAALTAAAITVSTPSVWATPSAPSVPSAPSAAAGRIDDAGSFCAFNSATGVLACVDDLQDYPAAKQAAGVEPDLGVARPGAIAAAQYLLGRFYDDELFLTTHGYIDWFASSPCTSTGSDIDSSWSDTTSWRSRISSFRAYSNCAIKAWRNTGYSGSSVGYTSSSSNVGSTLNDHVWSVRFT
ncbi:hypothetical protein [Nakamurella lactea]|uniref:hypothetical protein n=1 Tax=Nakamurella lactea TaxID=459515 RepID=UPI00040999A1|nr:hypothetical protein [Nakamurella lactea]